MAWISLSARQILELGSYLALNVALVWALLRWQRFLSAQIASLGLQKVEDFPTGIRMRAFLSSFLSIFGPMAVAVLVTYLVRHTTNPIYLRNMSFQETLFLITWATMIATTVFHQPIHLSRNEIEKLQVRRKRVVALNVIGFVLHMASLPFIPLP